MIRPCSCLLCLSTEWKNVLILMTHDWLRRTLKGIVHPKMLILSSLPSRHSKRVWLFFLQNTKADIFNNGNCIFWMGTKYLMFQKKKKVRFDSTWGWVIDDYPFQVHLQFPKHSVSAHKITHRLPSTKNKPMTSELSWCCVLGGPQLCHCIIEQIN